MEGNLAVAVITYNRPKALKRVLKSIAAAQYPEKIDLPLIISVDGGGSSEVIQIATEFKWSRGEKIIKEHKTNLGLRAHVLSVGDLTERFENLLVLEDDMYVSPIYFSFLKNSIAYYSNKDKIAGISLYTYSYNDHAGLPFIPLKAGYDVFFKQVPGSLGQVFQRSVWNKFKDYYHSDPKLEDLPMPTSVKNWPDSSWKKYFYGFMVKNDLYFVYPYDAYATNFCDAGTHFPEDNNWFQVPISTIKPKDLSFCEYSNHSVNYDAFYEPQLTNDFIQDIPIEEIEIDLNGSKDLRLSEKKYALSIKPCKKTIQSFSIELSPLILNAKYQNKGAFIHLGRKEDFEGEVSAKTVIQILKRFASFSARILIEEGKNEARSSTSYKLGHALIKPFLWLKK